MLEEMGSEKLFVPFDKKSLRKKPDNEQEERNAFAKVNFI